MSLHMALSGAYGDQIPAHVSSTTGANKLVAEWVVDFDQFAAGDIDLTVGLIGSAGDSGGDGHGSANTYVGTNVGTVVGNDLIDIEATFTIAPTPVIGTTTFTNPGGIGVVQVQLHLNSGDTYSVWGLTVQLTQT